MLFYFRQSHDYADIEDNDFAEFDFEDETDESLKVTDEEEDDFEIMEAEDDEAEVEVENEGDDEFSHFEDDEEFEGFKQEDVTDDPDDRFRLVGLLILLRSIPELRFHISALILKDQREKRLSCICGTLCHLLD